MALSFEQREVWRTRLEAFKASGQNGVAWCRENEISYHQFRYWLLRLDSEESPIDSASGWLSVAVGDDEACSCMDDDHEPSSVEVGDGATSEAGVTLLIRVGRASVEVKPGFDPVLLANVVSALAAGAC